MVDPAPQRSLASAVTESPGELSREEGSKVRRPADLRGLVIPADESAHVHTAAVAIVLALDAILVLFLSPGSSVVFSRGPPVYLVLPSAAAVYMSLASISIVAERRVPGDSARVFVFPALSLVSSAILAGLVATSGGHWGTVAGVSSSAWLYPACLGGITLPITGLWLSGLFDPTFRQVGMGVAVLPPLIALTTLSSDLSAGVVVALISASLLVSAALFQVSGTYLSRPPVPWAASARTPGPTDEAAPRIPLRERFGWRSREGGRAGSRSSLLGSRRARDITAEGPARSSNREGRWPDVVSTGFGWLDDLFLGGLPRRGQFALVGEAGIGTEKVVWGALAEGLRRGESVVIITASSTVREIAEQMERFSPGFTNRDREGRVMWVDASGRGSAARANPPAIQGPADCVRILGSLLAAAKEAEGHSPGGFCVGFLGVTSVLDAVDEPMAQAFLRNLVGILRQRRASVTLSIELTPRPITALSRILRELDGTLVFASVNGRTAVRVFGHEPVATRGWVECQFDHRGNYLRLPPSRPAGRHGRSAPQEARAPVP